MLYFININVVLLFAHQIDKHLISAGEYMKENTHTLMVGLFIGIHLKKVIWKYEFQMKKYIPSFLAIPIQRIFSMKVKALVFSYI